MPADGLMVSPVLGGALDLSAPRSRAAQDREGGTSAGTGDGQGQPGLGYRRIHGELAGLGYKLGPSTVWQILNDAGSGLYYTESPCGV